MASRARGLGGAAVVVEGVELFGEVRARAGSRVRKSSTTSEAMSMRPAALMRGARRKPTSVAVGGRSSGSLATCMRARRPGWTGLASAAQAERGDGAVFAGERDGVGDGGDGDELEEAGRRTSVRGGWLLGVGGERAASEQGVGEFEGDARRRRGLCWGRGSRAGRG